MKSKSLIGALASIAMVAGCSSANEPAQGRTARELNITLSSTNGLYFSPHLLLQRASVDDIVAAVQTAQLLGEVPRLRVGPSVQQKLRTAAIAAHGVSGYGRLARLYRVGATRVLEPSDAPTLQNRRHADGSFTPDRASGVGVRGQILATCSALLTLKTLHRLSPVDERKSIDWLRQVAASSTDVATVRLALSAIRQVDPARAPAYRGPAPDLSAIRTTPASGRQRLVDAAASYVDAVGAPAEPGRLDTSAIRRLYDENVATSDLPTLLKLVTLMRGSGAAAAALTAAKHRLDDARLPDGLYRDTTENFGSAIATVYALRLMRMRGESIRSEALARALTRYAELPQVRGNAAERLIAVGASVAAGDSGAVDESRRLCNDPAAVPSRVDRRNVVGWAELTQICSEAGTKSPSPQLGPWPASSTADVVAQAALVNALAATGRRAKIPSWVDRKAMQTLLHRTDDKVSLRDAAMVGSAYLALTGGDGRETLDNLRIRAGKARGCADLPDLYTNGGPDVSCDLRTTIAVENFLSA